MDFARFNLRSRALLLPLTLSAGVILSNCNAFEMLDSPSNDKQYLSAARACFDQGDLECARENYQKITTDADIKNSELALALLDEAGVTMGTFLSAFSGGGDGGAINGLAEALADTEGGASVEKRNLILEALQASEGIEDQNLRGFTRFLASLSLFAEVLAEIAGTNGRLESSDLASGGAACKALAEGQCAIAGPGDVCTPNTSQFSASVTAVDLMGSTSLSGTPSIGLINAIVDQLNTALSTELAVSGGFETGTGSIADQLAEVDSLFPGAADRCLTYTLLDLGIGR